jgi:hypothetical protein
MLSLHFTTDDAVIPKTNPASEEFRPKDKISDAAALTIYRGLDITPGMGKFSVVFRNWLEYVSSSSNVRLDGGHIKVFHITPGMFPWLSRDFTGMYVAFSQLWYRRFRTAEAITVDILEQALRAINMRKCVYGPQILALINCTCDPGDKYVLDSVWETAGKTTIYPATLFPK